MNFLAYKTLEQVNTSAGPHTLLVYVNEITSGLFARSILVTLWVIIALGAYFSQKRLEGESNLAVTFAVASFVTFGASIIMSFIPGLVTPVDIGIAVGFAMISAIWLLTDRASG